MPLPDELSDIALMLRVRGGEEPAFATLHQRYQGRVLHFFHGMSRNPVEAADLCQECFLRLWKIRRRFRATGSFPAYLFGIARHVWLERHRTEQRVWRLGVKQELPLDTLPARQPGKNPVERAERAELSQRLFLALDALPEDQRMVFILRCIEGMSLPDIAGTLDCPLNTVRSRKILAFKKLRYLLADLNEAEAQAMPGPPQGIVVGGTPDEL